MERASKIYVAGHTGLIGSAICRVLSRHGYFNVITRPSKELDLRRQDSVERFFKKERPKYVVLAAGRVGGILENKTFPATLIIDNLAIQLNVLQAAAASGVERLIFFGSSCMYPREARQPMREDSLLTGSPEPTSISYAVAKLSGVQMCLSLNQQLGKQIFLPVIPNSTYGPFDNFDPASSHVLSALIHRFVEATQTGAPSLTLWGSGRAKREFIYADDVAEACMMFLARDVPVPVLPLNLGSGTEVSISDLAQMIASVTGFTGAIQWDLQKPDGAPRKLLDSSNVTALGWSPKVDLPLGLAKTHQWYLANQHLLSETP
jgi:GDP-L-fucose synthase